MKNKHLREIIIASVLIVLLFMLANPYDIFMPSMIQMIVSIVIFILFSFFAAVILNEHAHDEREDIHRSLAGRAAFLSGSGVLIIGIIIQTIKHTLHIWLVIALVIMIITKVAVRMYSDTYK